MMKSWAAALLVSSLAGSWCVAAAVPGSFTAGVLVGAGFPVPLNTAAAAMGVKKGSANGATGGGFAGNAAAAVELTDSLLDTKLSITGHAEHNNANGYTSVYTVEDIVFTLGHAADFSVANLTTGIPGDFRAGGGGVPFNPIVFEAITGSITGDILTNGQLSAGTYRIRFSVAALAPGSVPFLAIPNGYADFNANGLLSADVDWVMTLTDVPGPGAGAAFAVAGALAWRRRRP